MAAVYKRIRGFLTTEEVPRWFGLSIVLIYLVGLGAVAQSAIVLVRREAAGRYEAGCRYAVKTLADRVARIQQDASNDRSAAIGSRVALRDFACHIPADVLRVVSERGLVLASTDPSEVGALLPSEDRLAVPDDGMEEGWSETPGQEGAVRVLIAALAAPPGEGAERSYLEARIPLAVGGLANTADQLSLVIVVLVVLGALFVVYRCLREQLRGVSRIADRLTSHQDRISDDLVAMRISDTKDETITSWNQLVDLAAESKSALDRGQADEELSRVLARSGGGALAEALNAVPDGIIHLTGEGRIDFANTSACRFLGCNATEVRGTALSDVCVEGVGEKIVRILKETLQASGCSRPHVETIEMPTSQDDEVTTCRLWALPLARGGSGGGCMVVIRDVSQQTRADRAREELIAQVTHELRTPLTNIRAYAETLSSGMFDDPTVVTECYNVITKETRRLSRLIEDMLSMSQLETGSIDLSIDQVDLASLLTDGVRDVRGLADEKGIDVRLALPAKLEPTRGDREKLAVVVNNLLGNAIKYTPSGGSVIVGCQIKGEETTITVKDSGIGISETDQARVFEKFFRAESADVQAEEGTGIGLYTAREIVRRHGGDIELISTKDQGTTFLVRLPHEETRASNLRPAEVS